MNRLITQKYYLVPNFYLFQYNNKTYVKYPDGVRDVHSKDAANQPWFEDRNALVWVDPFVILIELIKTEDYVTVHQIDGEDYLHPEEPEGILQWDGEKFVWNYINFQSSQVVHINQVTREVYVEMTK